jgi:hypothetical protein
VVAALSSGEDLFHPPVLPLFRRKKRKDKMKNMAF